MTAITYYQNIKTQPVHNQKMAVLDKALMDEYNIMTDMDRQDYDRGRPKVHLTKLPGHTTSSTMAAPPKCGSFKMIDVLVPQDIALQGSNSSVTLNV